MPKWATAAAILGAATLMVLAINFSSAPDSSSTSPPDPVISRAGADMPNAAEFIRITGTASSVSEPDLLIIRLGAETRADTVRQAASQNAQALEEIADAIVSAGALKTDIATSSYDIYPVYGRYDESLGRSPIIGYAVSNMLEITTKSTGIAPAIIDEAVSAGANRVDSVSFGLSKEKADELNRGLLSKAVVDARSRAALALDPLGYRTVGVKSAVISDPGGVPPQPLYAMERAMSERSPTPIFASDSQVSASATVEFYIGQRVQ